MVMVKICGLTRESDIESAAESGADRIGLVVVPASPRAVSIARAAELSRLIHRLGAEPWIVASWSVASGPCVKGLEALVEDTPEIAAVQLHGGEAPEDVEDFLEICPDVRIVKALGVGVREDLDAIELFEAADEFLLDAKPPRDQPAGAAREGGFGVAFDWTILEGFDPRRPWTLSGGLSPETVAEAVRITGADAVDVSSGVEVSPGIKDPARVRAFIQAAKAAG
ncbi:MAG: phosphoribosylanthranilate isomerase [Hyphomonadaceae bacterium]